MMWFIVIVLGIIFFLCGLSVMDKLDEFIQINEKNIQKNIDTKVFIYGDELIAKYIIDFLEKENINYEIVTEKSILDKKDRCKCLLVLTENDLDNLMVCSIGKRLLEIKNIIAVCNDRNNSRVFDQYEVISFNSDYIKSRKFLLMLKEKIENA